MNRKYQAIIFDMDGVIVDSEPRHERAFREIFNEMGYAEHGIHFPDYYGRSDRAVWTDFIAKHKPKQPLEELTEWKQRRFLELIRQDKPIFPGLSELVEALSREYPLAVASGSLHAVIEEVLALRELKRFFEAVVSVQDVARPKPSPDVFLRAAELLGVTPVGCCVIEDSAAGVEAAIAAGMSVIAITNSLPVEKLMRANHVVSSYQEIENLLL